MTTKDAKAIDFPNGWGTLAADYDPNAHIMSLTNEGSHATTKANP